LAVIATDAPLDRAQCRKLAELGHDALALAISPVHTMLDGDTVFALSTGTGEAATLEQQVRLGVAAVEVLRTAIERSVLAGL
jgi:L-aminopeptidase/D-esterase-like protein